MGLADKNKFGKFCCRRCNAF